ncbi:hypothetical protein [Mucilaginibacter psychrotolerans]|uniref:Uncharacterized protein n=1 Tax=Mucilaginibacter psychrotolerans TaxID=1524096 RepID=A0A4Y8S4A0_9SPHI|nr:hypothetical protein [Mucilaginibacter psychrotolerans]TFF33400.1 hypothetical protein E2R66_26060 [Mucilaginibacter psychrotolerans]
MRFKVKTCPSGRAPATFIISAKRPLAIIAAVSTFAVLELESACLTCDPMEAFIAHTISYSNIRKRNNNELNNIKRNNNNKTRSKNKTNSNKTTNVIPHKIPPSKKHKLFSLPNVFY